MADDSNEVRFKAQPIDDAFLEALGGTYRPNNGWMFGPNQELLIWRVGSGWGCVLGSAGPGESQRIATRDQVLALLYGLGYRSDLETEESCESCGASLSVPVHDSWCYGCDRLICRVCVVTFEHFGKGRHGIGEPQVRVQLLEEAEQRLADPARVKLLLTEDWRAEQSSGYNGFRHRKTGEWRYASEFTLKK